MRTQVEDALLDLRAEASPLTYLRLWDESQAPGSSPEQDVPLEGALGALVTLRDEGKVRHIGLSGRRPRWWSARNGSRRSRPCRTGST
ncbi:MAG: hypothetical protein L0K86_22440 [Actinomycetia bacterium]|nr:hypothetical protein [Actinomycetes bacterium]